MLRSLDSRALDILVVWSGESCSRAEAVLRGLMDGRGVMARVAVRDDTLVIVWFVGCVQIARWVGRRVEEV